MLGARCLNFKTLARVFAKIPPVFKKKNLFCAVFLLMQRMYFFMDFKAVTKQPNFYLNFLCLKKQKCPETNNRII